MHACMHTHTQTNQHGLSASFWSIAHIKTAYTNTQTNIHTRVQTQQTLSLSLSLFHSHKSRCKGSHRPRSHTETANTYTCTHWCIKGVKKHISRRHTHTCRQHSCTQDANACYGSSWSLCHENESCKPFTYTHNMPSANWNRKLKMKIAGTHATCMHACKCMHVCAYAYTTSRLRMWAI